MTFIHLKKPKWNSKMREISGMGEGYEEQCRKMLYAAIEWHNKNPNKPPRIRTNKNIYGYTENMNGNAEDLERYILDHIPGKDCSGAMMQAVLSHYFFIKKNGVEKWKEEMSK